MIRPCGVIKYPQKCVFYNATGSGNSGSSISDKTTSRCRRPAPARRPSERIRYGPHSSIRRRSPTDSRRSGSPANSECHQLRQRSWMLSRRAFASSCRPKPVRRKARGGEHHRLPLATRFLLHSANGSVVAEAGAHVLTSQNPLGARASWSMPSAVDWAASSLCAPGCEPTMIALTALEKSRLFIFPFGLLLGRLACRGWRASGCEPLYKVSERGGRNLRFFSLVLTHPLRSSIRNLRPVWP